MDRDNRKPVSHAREQVHRWANYVRTCRKAGDREEAQQGLHRVWLYRNLSRLLRADQQP